MWLCGKLHPGRMDWATSDLWYLWLIGMKHSKSLRLCQIACDFLCRQMLRWFRFEIEDLEHFLLKIPFARWHGERYLELCSSWMVTGQDFSYYNQATVLFKCLKYECFFLFPVNCPIQNVKEFYFILQNVVMLIT